MHCTDLSFLLPTVLIPTLVAVLHFRAIDREAARDGEKLPLRRSVGLALLSAAASAAVVLPINYLLYPYVVHLYRSSQPSAIQIAVVSLLTALPVLVGALASLLLLDTAAQKLNVRPRRVVRIAVALLTAPPLTLSLRLLDGWRPDRYSVLETVTCVLSSGVNWSGCFTVSVLVKSSSANRRQPQRSG
jgi:hypothetical protein